MDWSNIGIFRGPLLNLVVVGIFWGVTNPFIKRGTIGLNRIEDNNRARKIITEIIFLATNWTYMVPFVINQFGSVLFYFSLKDTDLTLAVPVCNSLAFVCTALTGWYLEEDNPNQTTVFGMLMIAFGISCYLLV